MFAVQEAAIVARLKAKVSPGTNVASLDELSRVPEMRAKAPAVLVIYEGYTPADSNPNVPHIQQIEQSWAVVCVAKNASGAGSSKAAANDVSAIALEVLDALLGFQVAAGVRLKLKPAPGPEYDAGFAYLPLGFSCRATFKGATA